MSMTKMIVIEKCGDCPEPFYTRTVVRDGQDIVREFACPHIQDLVDLEKMHPECQLKDADEYLKEK